MMGLGTCHTNMHTHRHRPTGLQWTQRGDVGEVKGEKISEKVTERLLCRFPAYEDVRG